MENGSEQNFCAVGNRGDTQMLGAIQGHNPRLRADASVSLEEHSFLEHNFVIRQHKDKSEVWGEKIYIADVLFKFKCYLWITSLSNTQRIYYNKKS